MKLKFYLFGKAKEPFCQEGYQEYLKRLSKYSEVSLTYLNESLLSSQPSDAEIQKALDEEADRALRQIKENDLLVLIDLHGKQMKTEEFAAYLKSQINTGSSSIAFLVGSSYGLSDKLRKRADLALCLSPLTTTHPLALLLTMEQVYRAFKINNNETYHK
jgi:23S rRNA (pseudouridine1915-N3)-methyltransferase